ELAIPERWSKHFDGPCRQMWLPHGMKPDSRAGAAGNDYPLIPLDARDVPEMLALVERTRPGPFAPRTIELGTYLGVRDAGKLVAMAGERMHPAGFVEISAVCTDATHRGRGL